jgi:hypothetical protein
MKKLFQLSMALLCVIVFASCSSEDSVAGWADGNYTVRRVTNMVNLPPIFPFTPLNDEVRISIDAVADDYVDVTLPSTVYDFNGQEMKITAFVIENVPVLADGEKRVFFPKHNFRQENGKYVEGTISGEIDGDGDVELTVEYRYGSMPYSIKQEFESID